MSRKSFIFAGGGTGGHIFPALAIAEAMRAVEDVRAHVVCSDREVDAGLLGRAVADRQADAFTPIPARPFGIRPGAIARLIGSWGVCVRAVRAVIEAERAESGGDVSLVALGGFVSAPAVQAARAERVPVSLVNLDVVPGLANRWVARRASLRFAAVAEPARPAGFRWEIVNPVVRRAVIEGPGARASRITLGLDPDAPTLLVTGGSLGAHTINTFVAAFLERHGGVLRNGGWQVLHQCGRDDGEMLSHAYASADVPGVVVPTVAAMGHAWAAADCAVARAGAGTVAEVWATATPTLFLPYPYHADQHQRLNAERLVVCGGAVLGEDLIDAERTLGAHGGTLLTLIEDEMHRDSMRTALRALGPADGASKIGERLLAG